jgi:hypothetical protein
MGSAGVELPPEAGLELLPEASVDAGDREACSACRVSGSLKTALLFNVT